MPCKKKEAISYFEHFENFSVKIPWDCFVYILTKLIGFEMFSKKGSVRLFVYDEIRFTAHEPHGRGDDFVSRDDRRRAINATRRLEALINERS